MCAYFYYILVSYSMTYMYIPWNVCFNRSASRSCCPHSVCPLLMMNFMYKDMSCAVDIIAPLGSKGLILDKKRY